MNNLLATEFKQQLEGMSRGQVEVQILEDKDVLIRPHVEWAATPDFVRKVFDEFMMTPKGER